MEGQLENILDKFKEVLCIFLICGFTIGDKFKMCSKRKPTDFYMNEKGTHKAAPMPIFYIGRSLNAEKTGVFCSFYV